MGEVPGRASVVISALVLCIWIYLVFGRGFFWQVRESRERFPVPTERPSVVAVIPARNEAAVVGRAVSSLLRSNYPLHVCLVDDHSTDGTAEAAGTDPRLSIIPARPLPAGWTGKLWALSEGARQTSKYLLLTDADIEHAAENVSQLIARAEAGGFDMVSLMVKLRCESFAERALIPAFVYFFFMLYPPGPETSGAAGGCILIRREALERIGGVAKIKGELIDDCALAREIKQSGGRVWLGVSQTTQSIRDYVTLSEIERMIARTAFTQLSYSVWILIGTVIGMVITYLAPPALALAGYPMAAGAWVLMAISYIPVLRFYGRSPLWAPFLPLVALFYLCATIDSAIQHWTGKGGMWKGRITGPRP